MILFTLDINNLRRILIYIFSGILCIIINYIYSQFSHGVSSNYMTYMFLIPVISGFVSILLEKIEKTTLKKQTIFANGVATLTIGCFINGILEIAGTSSNYQFIYYVAGVLLIILAFIKR